MYRTYNGYITELKDNECFVFGSNLDGFHGGGSAGYASFNETGNVWRKYNYHHFKDGTKWKWNVKGQAEGYQEGTEGRSYAIPTVTKPGYTRSISMHDIIDSIKDFYAFARQNMDMTFYVAYNGSTANLNGYTAHEMAYMFSDDNIPTNVVFEKEFHILVHMHILSETETDQPLHEF